MIFSTPSPDIIPLTISIILYVILLGLDAIVPWLKRGVSRFFNYANITLHIAFILSLMFVGVYIEVPVLCFMISLFAYSLSSFFAYKKAGNGADITPAPTPDEGDEVSQSSDTVSPIPDGTPVDTAETVVESSLNTQDEEDLI